MKAVYHKFPLTLLDHVGLTTHELLSVDPALVPSAEARINEIIDTRTEPLMDKELRDAEEIFDALSHIPPFECGKMELFFSLMRLKEFTPANVRAAQLEALQTLNEQINDNMSALLYSADETCGEARNEIKQTVHLLNDCREIIRTTQESILRITSAAHSMSDPALRMLIIRDCAEIARLRRMVDIHR